MAVSVLASIVLMTVDHRLSYLEPVRAALAVVVYPVQYAVDAPFALGSWLSEVTATRSALLEENARLKQQQLLIEARLGKYQELQAENRRLRTLLDSSVKAGERVLIAELLSVDMDPFSRKLLLNKGHQDGVYIGQPILDAKGVMGQVIHVTPITATALLLTDPSHALPVQLNRNGLRALAVGTGAPGGLELVHLPNNADIRVGDAIYTSGLGGRFPGGYPVGSVSSVESDAGQPFAKVNVTPTAQLERNREVLLVWPAGREDEATPRAGQGS